MTAVRERRLPGLSVLHVVGPLRSPVKVELRLRVRSLLRRGVRSILLDLSRVTDLDAAGLGELVRLYGMAVAENGVLQVACAFGKVRKLLDVAGLFELLTADSIFAYEKCS